MEVQVWLGKADPRSCFKGRMLVTLSGLISTLGGKDGEGSVTIQRRL